MNSNIYWKYNKKNMQHISSAKLLIVGPSGSGKTTLARYLCQEYSNIFEIIKNCTTRNRRREDKDNFNYYSVNEFNELNEKGDFFLARFGNNPLYGYKKDDYERITNNNKVPIFMFRLSGFQHLKNQLSNYFVIFILSDFKKSVAHSKDECTLNIFEETKYICSQIENEIKRIDKNEERYFVIQNNYKDDFFEQIERKGIVSKILKNND